MSEDLLRQINDRLGALLILAAFEYSDGTVERPPDRKPIEAILAGAGYGTKEIAEIVGKSQRTIQDILKKARTQGGSI
jgi:hypothetical protein